MAPFQSEPPGSLCYFRSAADLMCKRMCGEREQKLGRAFGLGCRSDAAEGERDRILESKSLKLQEKWLGQTYGQSLRQSYPLESSMSCLSTQLCSVTGRLRPAERLASLQMWEQLKRDRNGVMCASCSKMI